MRSGRTFSSKVSSEGSYLNRIAKNTPAFWAFDRRSGSIIDGVMAIWKFGLFFDLVTLFHDLLFCQCYLLELLTHSIWGPILVIICQSVRELCLTKRTDKQTNGQTNILAKKFWQVMKGQSEIAYLPKFANMMLIVMVIVITEILYIILIFDCFENQ